MPAPISAVIGMRRKLRCGGGGSGGGSAVGAEVSVGEAAEALPEAAFDASADGGTGASPAAAAGPDGDSRSTSRAVSSMVGGLRRRPPAPEAEKEAGSEEAGGSLSELMTFSVSIRAAYRSPDGAAAKSGPFAARQARSIFTAHR
jgi:hypothetical protein